MSLERILEIIENREYTQILRNKSVLYSWVTQYNIVTSNGGVIRIIPKFKLFAKRSFIIYLFVPSESKAVKVFRIESDDKKIGAVRNAYKKIVNDYNGVLQSQVDEKYAHFF